MAKDTEKSDLDGLESALGVKIFCKTVLLPITVSYGDYCWGNGRICEHFDNEGGYPRCKMGFTGLEYDKNRHIPKPSKCKDLREA